MPVSLPPSTNTPWRPDAFEQALRGVKGADSQAVVEYMRTLIIHLDRMYSEIADATTRLNTELQALKARYDVHNSHPPPA